MIEPREHPDDLLLRERTAQLADEELSVLDAHCATCPVCTLERSLGRQFDGLRVPTGKTADALIAAAMATGSPGSKQGSPSGSGGGSALSSKLILGGVLLSGAAVLFWAAPWKDAAGLAPRPRPVADVGRLAAPKLPSEVGDLDATSLVPDATPALHDASPDLPLHPVVRGPSDTGHAAQGRVASTKAPAVDAPESSNSLAMGPAELLAAANEARRQGETDRALALYRQLEQTFSASREAHVSHVSHGRLLLARDPRAALSEFDTYLAASAAGPLAEEALVGRALVFERFRDRALERAAWARLLADFPASVHATRARLRLSELGETR